MGKRNLLGRTVIRLSPDKSDTPFLNFPKIENMKYCFVRQLKHLLGTFNPTFSYKSKSPSSMTNFSLQLVQILFSVCMLMVLIDIHPRWAEHSSTQFVTLLYNFGHFVILFFFVSCYHIYGLMNTRIKTLSYFTN